ncbi:hypothetical protein ACHHYP_05753 [Achlya hypogyna]|uniref:PX domain-containing protein n=1 Tax=Achlya hypogyna TaxID=1202772 RepID=A0A1V9ZNJ5_ACHHY|nr:hypothetical protein ACHHYP_05753 [Achlya hypogyna]
MIYVGEAGKIGDGVNAYHVYPVRSSTDGPIVAEVDRRFSDFAWLHATLLKACPGCIVPPLPAKVVGLLHSKEFLEARRQGLQKFLTNVAGHDILSSAPCFSSFLCATNIELSQLKARAKDAAPKQALSSWFGKAVQKWSEHDKVQSLAAKAYGRDVVRAKSDADREFDQIATYVSHLEAHAKALQQKVVAAYRASKTAAAAYGDVIEATSALADLEAPLPEMKAVPFTSFVQLLDTRARHLDGAWGALADGVDDFARWIGSVQAALATREDRRFAYQAQLASVNKLAATTPESPTRRSGFGSFMASSPSPAAMASSLADAQAAYEEVHARVMSEVLKFREEKAGALKLLYLAFANLQAECATELNETLARLLPRMKETAAISVPRDEIRRAAMPSLKLPFDDDNNAAYDAALSDEKPYVDVSL